MELYQIVISLKIRKLTEHFQEYMFCKPYVNFNNITEEWLLGKFDIWKSDI